jgi:hypothetical protein
LFPEKSATPQSKRAINISLKLKVKYIDVVFEENIPSWQLISEKYWELKLWKVMESEEMSEIYLKF